MPKIHDHENEITYFGKTDFRQGGVKFGIKTDDRRRHMYIVGKTGMGKTTLLENMVLQDIYNGHGLCYMDPHGDTVEGILNFIPEWRMKDVVYFNPADLDFPIGFNVLDSVNSKHKHLVAGGLMGVFKKIWENMWSARMEYILGNTILALLDTPGSTLMGINRMYSDEAYRIEVIKNIKDPQVKSFWVMEYSAYSEKYATEAVAAVQNKIGQFLSADVIRNIVAQPKSTIDVRDIMDSKKIFLINLSKGRIGEDNSRLLGGMLITKVQIAAMERVDMPEKDREDFYLYVDEFQNFATESFASILSEARKYRLNLIVAHQYMAQLAEEVKDAVLGNVGTMVVFRVGAPDATDLETEMMPRFLPEDMINLPKFGIYLKLMIDGVSSPPFSAATLPPIAKVTHSMEKIIELSRTQYSKARSEVEHDVLEWIGFGEDADVESMIEDSKARAGGGGGGGQKKKKFKYKCSWTGEEFSIPVKLDRARPIYSEKGKEEVGELKKSGKYDSRKDLIYDEELNPVGSVAELGSDGSWAQRDDDGNIVGIKADFKKRGGGGGSASGGGRSDSGRSGSSPSSSSSSSSSNGSGSRSSSSGGERSREKRDDKPVADRKDEPKGASLDVLKEKVIRSKAESAEAGSEGGDGDRKEMREERQPKSVEDRKPREDRGGGGSGDGRRRRDRGKGGSGGGDRVHDGGGRGRDRNSGGSGRSDGGRSSSSSSSNGGSASKPSRNEAPKQDRKEQDKKPESKADTKIEPKVESRVETKKPDRDPGEPSTNAKSLKPGEKVTFEE